MHDHDETDQYPCMFGSRSTQKQVFRKNPKQKNFALVAQNADEINVCQDDVRIFEYSIAPNCSLKDGVLLE